MQTLLLHHSGPLGGILASNNQHEIVELRLRAGNEIPPYQNAASIILITLAPWQSHNIRATADTTHIIAIKSGSSAP